MNSEGNKAAKKARRGAVSTSDKRDAVAFEVAEIMEHASEPGAYQFTSYNDERVGLIHACPCGCGQIGALYWKNPRKGGANWTVSGEWPRVTLRPSIGFWGQNSREQGHHWHGYLTDGVFKEI